MIYHQPDIYMVHASPILSAPSTKKQVFKMILRYFITLITSFFGGWNFWIYLKPFCMFTVLTSFLLFQHFMQPKSQSHFTWCYSNLLLNFRLRWSSGPLYQWKAKCFQRTIHCIFFKYLFSDLKKCCVLFQLV